ncbi:MULTISPECIES: hypothetical protein [unclassified Haladaptatus]|uniref:hypothetical protein n=1 Tax=unclassified Haladaptatus TaxID=2622732 RepID=UPI0023E78B54|nr:MULTISPECIES: hypothetical protein [unclassified Haladaptatus]
MYVEIEREDATRSPVAGDEPIVPGATMSCRAHLKTTVYRNIWVITVDSIEELAALIPEPISVLPAERNATDAKVVIHTMPERPVKERKPIPAA